MLHMDQLVHQRRKSNDLKSRIKRIFSSSKLENNSGDTKVNGTTGTEDNNGHHSQEQLQDSANNSSASSDTSENMDTNNDERPVVKPRKKNGFRQSRENLETVEVHGTTKPKGILRNTVNNLAEIAQLTIQNERLCQENDMLRRQTLQFLHETTPTVNGETSNKLRLSHGKHDKQPTLESLLLDRELLENLVWRLNVELGRYETRIQLMDPDNVKLRADDGTPAPVWCRADPNTLAPLLHAYDETILEKETLIEQYSEQVRKLGAELREVVSENERLHESLEEVLQKESEARNDMERLEHDVRTLHDENVILLDKLESEKTKYEDLVEEYRNREAHMQELEQSVIDRRTDVKKLARECRILEDKYAAAKVEIENSISKQHHDDSMAHFKKLMDEVLDYCNRERTRLESEKEDLTKQNVYLQAELRGEKSKLNEHEIRVSSLEALLKKYEGEKGKLQMKLVSAESCRDSSVQELHQVLAMSEKLAEDQEILLYQLQHHQGTNRRLTALHASLKSVQKEIPAIERHLRAQEDGVERMKGDHQREIVRLHSLLRQKEQAIKLLEQERKNTCDELAMVWKVSGLTTVPEKDSSQPHSLPETHGKNNKNFA